MPSRGIESNPAETDAGRMMSRKVSPLRRLLRSQEVPWIDLLHISLRQLRLLLQHTSLYSSPSSIHPLLRRITWEPLCFLLSNPVVFCYTHITCNLIKAKNVMCNTKLDHSLRPVLPLYDYVSWCAPSLLCNHQKEVNSMFGNIFNFYMNDVHLSQGFQNLGSQLKFLHAGFPFLTRTPEL